MMVPVIAGAVHDGVEPGVGEAVLRVTGLDTERTAQVMLPTAPAQCTPSCRLPSPPSHLTCTPSCVSSPQHLPTPPAHHHVGAP